MTMNSMKSSLASGLAAAAMLLGSAGTAHADARQDFSILNSIGSPIMNLYVSPHSDNSWGEDVLGVDVLQNGQTANIHFDASTDPNECMWDVKIVESDGDQWVVQSLNLCTVSAVTFMRRGNSVIWQSR